MACIIHKWKGCKCDKCGKIRNEQHNWIGFRCHVCGAINDEIEVSFTDEEQSVFNAALTFAPRMEQTTDDVTAAYSSLSLKLNQQKLSRIEVVAILAAVKIFLPFFIQQSNENEESFDSMKRIFKLENIDCEKIIENFILKYEELAR